MKLFALLLSLAAPSAWAADATWSCAAYCRYHADLGNQYKALTADGPTLGATFKNLADQCDALTGILIGGNAAGAGQQNTMEVVYGVVAATQACAKN